MNKEPNAFFKEQAARGRAPEAQKDIQDESVAALNSDVDSMVALGKQYLQSSKPELAVTVFEKAYQQKPTDVDIALNYALALVAINKKALAITVLQRFGVTKEKYPFAQLLLAHVLTEYGIEIQSEKIITDAVAVYTDLLSVHQEDANVWNNLGMCLLYLQKLKEAERCFLRAIQINGGVGSYYNNIAMVARLKHLPDLSVSCCQKALALQPNNPEAYNNLGNALKDLNDLQGAELAYQKAFVLKPSPDFQCNLAMVQLALGKFRSGWELYEARKAQFTLKCLRDYLQSPQWRGEPAPGKKILIYCEQGFGDTIQFSRYVSMVKEKGLHVTLLVQRPLVRLMQSLHGPDVVITEGQPSYFEVQCPILSLPLAFQTDLGSIPSMTPYLFAVPEDVRSWQRAIPNTHELNVGLVWSGQTRRQFSDFGLTHKQRSMPAELFLPLMDVAGVRYFSLQKDGPPPPPELRLLTLMEACHDFADTAALIMNLDLVITVDTAVAHLAGALGKPVWVLNRFSGCWRWLRDRDDTPWYPTMRLFTQTAANDWAGVISRVKLALESEVAARARRTSPGDGAISS